MNSDNIDDVEQPITLEEGVVGEEESTTNDTDEATTTKLEDRTKSDRTAMTVMTTATKPTTGRSPRRTCITRAVVISSVLALLALAVLVPTITISQGNDNNKAILDPDDVEGPYPDPSGDVIEGGGDAFDTSEYKTRWPGLVGSPGQAAKAIIKEENPSLTIVTVLPVGTIVTRDYRTDRCRIFVDESGVVAEVPAVG